MYEKALDTDRRKARLILTNNMPVTTDLELGDTGSLDVILQAEEESIEMSDEFVEVRSVRFKVLSAKNITRIIKDANASISKRI